MFKNIVILMSLSFLILVAGCVTNPNTMPTYQFDSKVVAGSPENSIITSVISVDSLSEIGIPKDGFGVFRQSSRPAPPSRLDSKPTIGFSKKFAGVPIDGNFRVEVASGEKELGFEHYDARKKKEFVIRFYAKPGHIYYTKFIEVDDKENYGFYRVKPIVYDVSEGKSVSWEFVSDDIK